MKKETWKVIGISLIVAVVVSVAVFAIMTRLSESGVNLSPVPFVYGDINQNGAFGMEDVNYLSDVILQRIKAPVKGSSAFRAGDVNGDIKVDITDMNLMVDKILGRISLFPVETNMSKIETNMSKNMSYGKK